MKNSSSAGRSSPMAMRKVCSSSKMMCPILREKDILTPAAADTPCKRIYFAIQLMYVDEKNLPEHHKTFWELVKDVAEAAPSRKPMLKEISENILNARYYQALKLTKKLIDYEREVTDRVRTAT